jgi:hypothetical protein
MKLLLLLVISLAAAVAVEAQTDFHAYTGTEQMLEGGTIEKLTINTGNYLFAIRPPHNWPRVVDEPAHRITFASPSGRSAITVHFTADSPDALPDDDTLRYEVTQAHPGAGIIQMSVCPTSYQPGKFFDLVLVPAPGVVLKIRHAYIPQPVGEVEFVLSGSDDEFESNKVILMAMVRAFRADPAKPKPS